MPSKEYREYLEKHGMNKVGQCGVCGEKIEPGDRCDYHNDLKHTEYRRAAHMSEVENER